MTRKQKFNSQSRNVIIWVFTCLGKTFVSFKGLISVDYGLWCPGPRGASPQTRSSLFGQWTPAMPGWCQWHLNGLVGSVLKPVLTAAPGSRCRPSAFSCTIVSEGLSSQAAGQGPSPGDHLLGVLAGASTSCGILKEEPAGGQLDGKGRKASGLGNGSSGGRS